MWVLEMGQTESSMGGAGVAFYTEPGYGGTELRVEGPITVNNVASKGAPVNELSSLKIPAGYEVFLFRHSNLQGDHRHFRGPLEVENLAENSFDDATTSVVVAKQAQASDVPEDSQFILYYQGCGASVEGLLLDAPMELANVNSLGIPNSSIKSIKTGKKVKLSVFDKKNFFGIIGPLEGNQDQMVANSISSLRAMLQSEKANLAEQGKSAYSWAFWLGLLLLVGLILLAIYLSR